MRAERAAIRGIPLSMRKTSHRDLSRQMRGNGTAGRVLQGRAEGRRFYDAGEVLAQNLPRLQGC
jgi:hypothetical protein